MKMKTHLKAGSYTWNHNQTLVRDQARAAAGTRSWMQPRSLKVQTHVKAGRMSLNHNQTLVRPTAK
jgi:hypothetical protein